MVVVAVAATSHYNQSINNERKEENKKTPSMNIQIEDI